MIDDRLSSKPHLTTPLLLCSSRAVHLAECVVNMESDKLDDSVVMQKFVVHESENESSQAIITQEDQRPVYQVPDGGLKAWLCVVGG